MTTKDAKHLSYKELLQEVDQLEEQGFQKQSGILYTVFQDLSASDEKCILYGPDIVESLSDNFRESHANSYNLLCALEQIQFEDGWFHFSFYKDRIKELAFGGANGNMFFDPDVYIKAKLKPDKIIMLQAKGVYASKSDTRSKMSTFPVKSGVLNKDGKVELKVKVAFASKEVELDLEELFN